MGTMNGTVQEDLSTTPNVCQQPQGGSNMNEVGTDTSNVVIEPTRSGLRTSSMEANAQTSIPIVDVSLPSWGTCNNTSC